MIGEREFALISQDVPVSPSRHAVRRPTGRSELFSRPRVVLIQKEPEGWFVYRFDAQGIDVGDTWHEDRGSAKMMAAAEYGSALGEWQSIPDDVADSVAYVLSRIR